MRRIKISACQFPVERITGFAGFAARATSLLEQAPRDSQYVIFPELMTVGLLTTFADYDRITVAELTRIDRFTGEYRQLFRNAAAERGQTIIAGSHLEKREGGYFNIAHIFTADGREIEHRKTHIFPAESQWQSLEGDTLEVWDVGPARIGVAVCYEAEIPEVSRILSLKGAEIVFCPSYTFTEFGFWRVRHCAQARCIENQIYFVHCCTIGHTGAPLPDGYGRSSILSPCDTAWTPNGIVAEAETNKAMAVTGEVDLDAIYENRERGAATTFRDRSRREPMYCRYEPYRAMETEAAPPVRSQTRSAGDSA